MSTEDCRKEVWEGKIPVCFILSQDELPVGGNVHPEPSFMLLPRMSYFPLVYDKLEKLYARAVGASLDDKIWLSFGPTPLKWHYPIGVLYDLHGKKLPLPWEVTVHFKNYPTDDILIYEGKEALEGHFKSRIKEADWLKHGAKVIQQLTPQDFGHLWQGFLQGNFDEFWSVNQKLMLNIRGEEEPFKYIPFCIYREGEKLFQRLVSSERTTFGDLMLMYYKDSDISRNAAFLVHGIEIPQDTSLQWISEHLCHPDNFLHIVVTNLS